MGQYDPLGLASAFLVRLKLLMRQVCREDGSVTGWDEPVSPEVREKFLAILREMKELRNLAFPRSIKPASWDPSRKPML
ncbi:hypothetical protein DC007_14825, partial [Enterococcus faecalis]